MSVRLEEVGAGPKLRRGVRGEEDLQRQRAARRLVGDLRGIARQIQAAVYKRNKYATY